MKYDTVCGLFLAVVLNSVHAQEMPENYVTFQFSLLGWEDTLRDLHYFSGGEDNKVFVGTGAPSDYYDYTGPLPVTFYTVRLNEETGLLERLPQLTVDVDPEVRQWLFVLMRNRDEAAEEEYRILKIPDDDNGARPNSFLFYNFTKQNLAVQVDEDLTQLAAGRFTVMELSTETGKNVTIQAAAQSDGTGWELVYRSRWSHPKGRKIWVFITPGQNNRPEIRKFQKRSQTRVRDQGSGIGS